MSLSDLAKRYEEKAAEVAADQARLAELRQELAARIAGVETAPARASSTSPASTGGTIYGPGGLWPDPRIPRPLVAPAKRGAKFFGGPAYWRTKREQLLSDMEPGRAYTGKELEAMAAAEGGPETFIRQVRQPLLEARKIRKVTADGGRWRKGMFPASVRWMKA